MTTPRIPGATYRLQFNHSFRFDDARALVPYLHALGITDLYASPFLKARRGSPHGYDVTDHSTLNPEIGSDDDLAELTSELARHGMGLVVDVVPNHMGIDETNRWWWDVLENGPSSPYAKFFDIDWAPPKENFTNEILLPILGDHYGKVLENGEIRLLHETGAFFITYYDRRFPAAPRTATAILEPACERVSTILDADDPHLVELESIITALHHLPPRTETDPEKIRVRQREKEVAKRRLAALTEASDTVREAIEQTVAEMNGRPNDPRSFDRLEAFLANQPYRLCYWRVASDEINYRRFFDINDLAAIRVEEPEVFEAVHAVTFQLLSKGRVMGLRIDHPDGLFDPVQYFLDLQAGCDRALQPNASGAVNASAASANLPCYIVVEKILVRDEQLRPDWAVHGTTGYDFLNLLNGIFIDPAGARPLHALYAQLTGRTFNFGDVAYASKKLILDGTMSGELHMLARRLDRISEQHRWSRDFTLFNLQEALAGVIACFPVYRTYIRAASNLVSDEDRRYILSAVRTAKRRNPTMSQSIFDFITSVLLLQDPEGLSGPDQAERRNFVMRFQQITGPIMAKGVEDTAFYRAYPLASLNDVGGNPERFGLSVEEFHRHNAERLANWPQALLTTSTHDTKRSEDVRARINVLSEMPREWERAIQRWQALNRAKKVELEGAEVPDANEEYLLYQTLIGAWPLDPMDEEGHQQFVERIERYMEKALKEAKLHTSWINPDEAYDEAVRNFVRAILTPYVSSERRINAAPRVRNFVRAILTPHGENPFLADFLRFQGRIVDAGMWNSLTQVLLKITLPGVPDFYQGTELWDFSLVDPDNRRPVDFQKRVSMLDELSRQEARGLIPLVRDLLARRTDGGIKLYVTYKALNFRQAHRQLFEHGDYLPIRASGKRTDHVAAFARCEGNMWALIVVPRLLTKLSSSESPPVGRRVWKDTLLQLPQPVPEHWHNVLTGETLRAAGSDASKRSLFIQDVLRRLPVALLAGAMPE
jgi:(1->4)-alpha-D-glucan 1-alpha-D-glucosylmutase